MRRTTKKPQHGAPATNEMLSVFLLQEQVTSEAEAKKILKARVSAEGVECVGGRVVPPSRANKKRWLVQVYYAATEGRPPHGMARLSIPANDAEQLAAYGLTHH